MRVNGDAEAGRGAAGASRRPDQGRAFSDALARARGGQGPRGGAQARVKAAVPANAVRRAAADRAAGILRERKAEFREEERTAVEVRPPPGAAIDAARAGAAEPAEAPALRAAIRVLPTAIDAARVREGAPLELALGRALSVELRAGRGGVEIVLRPDPALAREARAELPGLVQALRGRGIAVARAEVRARGLSPGEVIRQAARARVDAGPGLR